MNVDIYDDSPQKKSYILEDDTVIDAEKLKNKSKQSNTTEIV